MMTRSCRRRFTIERLDDRIVLDSAGPLDGTDRYYSLSFAHDGTNISGQPSSLFAKFDAVFGQADWQTTILRAFQTWARESSVDIGLVAESGNHPFGAPGPSTADPRFGDLRIGARPLAENAMAVSVSQDSVVSGTWAADVIFNSESKFDSLDDLFSVALHEAGHVFGLAHSPDPKSPMHVHGVSSSVSLTSADVDELHRLLGQRTPDLWEGPTGNELASTAAKLEPIEAVEDADGSGPSIAFGDITTSSDIDFYSFESLGEYAGPITIQLHTAGISSLAPDLTLTDESGNPVGRLSATTPPTADFKYVIPQADSEEKYFIRVQAGASNEFSLGGYTLTVTFDDALRIDRDRIDSVARSRLRNPDRDELAALLSPGDAKLLNEDNHTDDDREDAGELQPLVEFEDVARFKVTGSLADATDEDHYKFTAPDGPVDSPRNMTVSVRSLDAGRVVPSVEILDDEGQHVDAQTLVNGGGALVVQATSTAPGGEYFLRIAAASNELFTRGNYELTVSFPKTATAVQPFVHGTIGNDVRQDVNRLHFATPQLFHFALSVAESLPASDATRGVLLRLIDEVGRELHQIVARPGETRTAGSVLLSPGSYALQAVPLSLVPGDMIWTVDYSVSGTVTSDPFAVDPEVPSELEFACPNLDGMFCYPGGVISEDPFLWFDFLDSLPDVPNLGKTELYSALLGNWWSWYWTQSGTNGPPLAMADGYQINVDERLDHPAVDGLLANDVDAESDAMIALLIEQPKHGSVMLDAAGAFSYQPEQGFSGIDVFTYQAYDFRHASATATVTITVSSANGARGDFNLDGAVDESDLNQLAVALRDGVDSTYDVNEDGGLSQADWDFMVHDVLHTTFGDANLDGQFDSSDLVLVFQIGRYEDNVSRNATWSSGDWNGDGEFDSSDLVAAFQSGKYETVITAA